MKAPLRYFERCAWVALGVIAVGCFLQFGLGRDWILYNSGARRYLLFFNLNTYLMAALCLALVMLVHYRGGYSYKLLMYCGAVFPNILAASRTGYMTVIVVTVIAAIASGRSWRGIIVMGLTFSSAFLILSSEYFQETFGIRTVTLESLTQDEGRTLAMQNSMYALRENPRVFVHGLGWGSSGFEGETARVIVHNTPLQVLVETGVPVGLAWLTFLATPLYWLIRSRHVHRPERLFALLLYALLFVNWMFHPLSSERIHWLPFAIVLGFAYRLHLQHLACLKTLPPATVRARF